MLKDKVKKFPLSPGVYRFIGKSGEILYIGRATYLRRRVLQYFGANIAPRTAEMVSLARDVKFQTVDTFLDSVVLEANLIKKYWPKYNVLEKDGKSFLYIIIGRGDYPYPKMIRARDLKKFPRNNFQVFGPYQSQWLAKEALKIIRKIFPYSTCTPDQGRPCFDHQIGLCPGICVGAISKKDYQNNIKNIALFLGGQKKRLITKLKKENPEQVRALNHIQDVTLMANDDAMLDGPSRIEGYDISHLAGKETYGSMVVFSHGKADKDEYRLFKVKAAPAGDDLRALAEVLLRRFNHPEWAYPEIIMIDGGAPQISFIHQIFRQHNITTPIVGISKYSGDRLVFPAGTKSVIKELAKLNKNILIQVRDEAHRFCRQASRYSRRIK